MSFCVFFVGWCFVSWRVVVDSDFVVLLELSQGSPFCFFLTLTRSIWTCCYGQISLSRVLKLSVTHAFHIRIVVQLSHRILFYSLLLLTRSCCIPPTHRPTPPLLLDSSFLASTFSRPRRIRSCIFLDRFQVKIVIVL